MQQSPHVTVSSCPASFPAAAIYRVQQCPSHQTIRRTLQHLSPPIPIHITCECCIGIDMLYQTQNNTQIFSGMPRLLFFFHRNCTVSVVVPSTSVSNAIILPRIPANMSTFQRMHDLINYLFHTYCYNLL
jgi:hypothetical protein